MQITAYGTSKRQNSTLVPTGGNSVTATLKSPTSLINPAFELLISDWNNATMIGAFGRYYFVNDVVYNSATTCVILCTIDPLASHKAAILSTSAMIAYETGGTAGGTGTRVMDSRLHLSNVPSVHTSDVDVFDGLTSSAAGSYVLSAVGSNGGVTNYVMGRSQMSYLLDTIGADITDELEGLTDITDILKYFTVNNLLLGSAVQAIRACKWFPVSTSNMPTGSSQVVYLGDFNTGVSAPVLSATPYVSKSVSIPIPWPVSDWKRKCCQMLLYMPLVGTIAIPVDQCNNETTLTVISAFEFLSGTVSIRIVAGNYCVFTGGGVIGSDYAIGSSNVPLTNFVTGTIMAAGGLIQAGAGVASIISSLPTIFATAGAGSALSSEGIAEGGESIAEGALKGAIGATQALTPVIQCAGSMSGNAATYQYQNALLCLLYYAPIGETAFSGMYGAPHFQIGTPPTSGFCQTQGFSVAGSMTFKERVLINQYMDNGVFIE